MAITTRRQLLSAAAAAYALRARAAFADAPPKSEPQLLRELLAVELLQITVYRRVIATGLLSPRVLRAARHVIAQELAHARTVRGQLHSVGGSAAPAVTATDPINKALSDLKISSRIDKLHSEHDCVQLLLNLEMAAEAEYFQAIGQFRDPALARLGAEILASEAQHQTTVSEARRPGDAAQAVPSAFVGG